MSVAVEARMVRSSRAILPSPASKGWTAVRGEWTSKLWREHRGATLRAAVPSQHPINNNCRSLYCHLTPTPLPSIMSRPYLLSSDSTDNLLGDEEQRQRHRPTIQLEAQSTPSGGRGSSSGRFQRSRSVRYVAAQYEHGTDKARQFWGRLSGKGRRRIGWGESFQSIAVSSCEYFSQFSSFSLTTCGIGLNVLFVIVPIAWASYWAHWGQTLTFACECACAVSRESLLIPDSVGLIAIIPLEHMLDWGGEQMSLYLGRDFGDLLIVTLSK